MANLTVMELLENKVEIFNFDYDFYNEDLKKKFEKKFIDHYLMEEIGFETIGLFKHYLRTSLNEMYPFYRHLYETTSYIYNPILNYDVNEEIVREIISDSTSSSKGEGKNFGYDTPRIKTTDYKNSPSNINEDSTSNEVNSNGNQKENYNRVTKGNIGVMTTQDLIMKERAIIINIDKQILEELNNLFMGVY